MTTQRTALFIIAAILIAIGAYVALSQTASQSARAPGADGTPYDATLSGTYTCLPHTDTAGPQTTECAFGLLTDEGDYYAVNFGASADAATQFQSGSHIKAQGNIVIKEALNSDHWQQYNMKGIFTITNMLEVTAGDTAPTGGRPGGNAKINPDAVCEGALAYMTFPDGDAAAKFVAECKEGKHPEVFEHYKAQFNIEDGKAI